MRGLMHHSWLGIPGWLICGSLAAWIATSKGRSGCLWFAACLFFGPIAIVVAALVPSRLD